MPIALPLDRLFAALADRTRLRLLSLMADKEICVCYLVESLRMPQPTISRHLAYLRESGVVEARREGKWMHYRIARLSKAQQRILGETLRALRGDEEIRADRKRLASECCAPQIVAIEHAPQPRIL